DCEKAEGRAAARCAAAPSRRAGAAWVCQGPRRAPPSGSDLPRAHQLAIIVHVQAALLGLVAFPPPAAGALVLAGLDGTGPRLAADRGVALRVQRIDRDLFGLG